MRIIDLNGIWEFVADLDPKYHAIHGGHHRPDANRRDWLKVPVPGVWQKYGERYDIFEGVCWFAREFDLPEMPANAMVRLRFGAVNYLANIYLNGERAGGHEGGYTEFVIDVSGKVKPGRNHLAVQVDNRATTIKWPPCLGYFNYGGIHRGVRLEMAAEPALDDVRITAVPSERGGVLQVSGRVLGEAYDDGKTPHPPCAERRAASPARGEATPVPSPARGEAGSDAGKVNRGDPLLTAPSPLVGEGRGEGSTTVAVSCGGKTVQARVKDDGAFAVGLELSAIEPWTPGTPRLYDVAIALHRGSAVVDRCDATVGFRAIAMRDGKVHLNGQPYPLKGVCYVYDSPGAGLVMTPEQIETDLRLMKEMGCNAVRCHYPMDAAFYDACDRLGMLVWIEPPVYCYHPGDHETGTRFSDPAWLALAQQAAREMIAVARNHPSVAIYSIGNECNTANPEAGAFFRELAATIRAEDPTRLLSYAALYGIVGSIADIVDVLGINSYWGWYDQIRQDGSDKSQESRDRGAKRSIDLAPMRKMLDGVLAKRTNLALFLTEFGADSVPGRHSGTRDLWSEDYHADLLREILTLAKDYPQIVGTFPFCFGDYRDPSKVHNGYWNELNLKGVVDYRRGRKLAFDAVRREYGPTLNPEP